MDTHDPSRCFDWLLKAMDRECRLQEREANHESQEAALSSMLSSTGRPSATLMAVSEPPSAAGIKEQNQAKAVLQQQNAILKQQKELAQVFAVGGVPGVAGGAGTGKGKKGKGKGDKTEELKQEAAVLEKRDANNKPPCFWFHTTDGCRRDTACPFSHTLELNETEKAALLRLAEKRQKSRSVSREPKGKGKGKGKAADKDANGKEICFQFRAGHCTFGDRCRFSHE